MNEWVRPYLDSLGDWECWEDYDPGFLTCDEIMRGVDIQEQARTPFLHDGYWYYFELSWTLGHFRRKRAI